MKKQVLLACVAMSLGIAAKAQFNYSVNGATNVAGTYTDLGSNGSMITTSSYDDANSAPQNIGFSFSFNGQSFTQFVLNTNGFIKLGSSNPSRADLYNKSFQRFDSMAVSSSDPLDVNIISALNHDLAGALGSTEYRVFTSGAVGSRTCTIQYKNVHDKDGPGAAGTILSQYSSMEFQIILHETGTIEVVYGTWTATTNASAFHSSIAGVKGNTNTDVVRASKASASQWSATIFLPGTAGYDGTTSNPLNWGNGTRPAPDAGRTFRFESSKNNDLSVSSIYVLEKASSMYSNPQKIYAVVNNIGVNAQSNISVNLSVTGANSFTASKMVTIAGGQSVLVEFDNYSPASLGSNTVTVSVPSDDNNANNSSTKDQTITNGRMAHTAATKASGLSLGYNTGTGLILAKYNSNQAARLRTANIYISNNTSNIGNKVYAVALDAQGNLLAKSDSIIIADYDTAHYHSFGLNVNVLAGDFFVGLAQTKNVGTTGYYPMGTAEENDTLGRAAFYISSPGLSGGTPPMLANGYGAFMIEADFENTVGVTKIPAVQNAISIFPNPVNDILTISSSLALKGDVTINIFNVEGKLIKSETKPANGAKSSVNVAELSAGAYLIEVKAENASSLSKFMKN